MNKAEITSVLCDLYKMSGFRVSLHGINFEEVAAYPEKKLSFCEYIQKASKKELDSCIACDMDACKRCLASGETIIYKCRHGLVEAISPLYNFGALTGFLMMGQVNERGSDLHPTLSALARLGKEDFDARVICAEIPTVNSDMIRSYVNIMTICAQYLTLSNAVTSSKPTVGQLVRKYVSENYTKKISVKDICDKLGYSKSTVLAAFKKEFGTTVNTYIANMRLSQAKKMLEDGERTINDIALSTGFTDQSYFSKVFSAKYGITPSDYRKDEVK